MQFYYFFSFATSMYIGCCRKKYDPHIILCVNMLFSRNVSHENHQSLNGSSIEQYDNISKTKKLAHQVLRCSMFFVCNAKKSSYIMSIDLPFSVTINIINIAERNCHNSFWIVLNSSAPTYCNTSLSSIFIHHSIIFFEVPKSHLSNIWERFGNNLGMIWSNKYYP